MNGKVSVMESGLGPLARTVSDGAHALVADEPSEVGGTGLGPDPYSLLLMSLGACTSMTLRMYADRKGWPLARVTIELGHSRIHAHDANDRATRPSVVDLIEQTIVLEGDLSDEQRSRLLQIAGKCPVHRALEGRTTIRTAGASATS